MLTTLLPPTAGRARVAGFDVATHGADVRRNVGAALQEAALDPFLTGREHMDLQAGLHGLSKAERARRGDRAARARRPDRRRRSQGRRLLGGMKRRLDLALALVHGPCVLFLDEPTTGLDPQSRSALWDEVQRLATDDGVTVFLTTQYLEEADVLADRVGIIDRGHIVAEGTPTVLKREIGGTTVEAVPADPHDTDRAAEVLARFGEPAAPRPRASRCAYDTAPSLADIVRALDDEGVAVGTCRCTRRRSTTSSWPRPAARWRAPARPRPTSAGEPVAGVTSTLGSRSACSRGARSRRTAAPAGADRAVDRLPAVPAGRQRQRPERGHEASPASRPTPT